jgi:hypothetical protein
MKLLLALSLVAGCVLPTSAPDDDRGDDRDDDDMPDPMDDDVPDDVPPSIAASGTYRVRSAIDVTAEAVLPERVAGVVVTLRDFSDQPAHTLIGLAEDAGVPAVSELRALLPAALESKLEGWLDDEIARAEIDGVPVTVLAGEIAALAETALTRFALDSELELGTGRATPAIHRLTAIDLAPAGIAQRVAFDIEIAAPLSAVSSAGALALGDHGFGLAYGEYVWRACDAAIAARFDRPSGENAPGGIRAVLGEAVDCPRVAQAIAGRCMLGVCVGHADLLAELCERGLDEVVERAHAKVAELRFDALRFAAGTAQLVDATQDGIADALTGGVWTAEINAGAGLRHAPATFEATR